MHERVDGALIVGGQGVVGLGRKFYLGPAEIESFSSQDFRESNAHDTFWHVMSTGYFYVLFLRAITVSDVRNTAVTQITISINVFLYLKHYTVLNKFFIKIHFKVFYIQIWCCEASVLFFLTKTMIYRDNSL